MEVLKIKLYQNLCNYRKEGSFGYVQTYPLPTPSMIRGMVHDILELTEYNPMKIGIQGRSDAVVTNIQKVYKFDRKRTIYICPVCRKEYKDNKKGAQQCHNVKVAEIIKKEDNRQIVKNISKALDTGIQFVDLHVNMNLIIHVFFENNNDNLCNQLYQKIQERVPVLGRNEDLALIEYLKIIKLQPFSGRNALSKFPMYVPKEVLIENVGTRYRLPFWYERVNSFAENRIFHYIEVSYISENVQLRKDSILEDEDKDIVVLLSANR